MQATPGAMLDAVAEAGAGLAEVDLGAVMPSGGTVASGKRASKLGTGGPGLGFGPGDGGVAREQRWSIIYNPDQTLEEYARQLDALGVELAVVAGPTSSLTSRTSPAPSRPSGTARAGATTGSTSSGRAEAGRRRTSPCFAEGGDRRRRRGRASVLSPGASRSSSPSSRCATRPAARRDPGHPVQRRPRGQRLRLPGPRPGDVALTRDRGRTPRARMSTCTPRSCPLSDPELNTSRMATLEVHDGQGRVQFVELRARPPRPLRHERGLRHRPGRRGDLAGARADPLEEGTVQGRGLARRRVRLINGHKMTSSSLHQGDEMTVGRCRLFMLRLDEPAEAGPPAGRPGIATRSERGSWKDRISIMSARGRHAAGGRRVQTRRSSTPLRDRRRWSATTGSRARLEIDQSRDRRAPSPSDIRRPESVYASAGRPRAFGSRLPVHCGRLRRWFRAPRASGPGSRARANLLLASGRGPGPFARLLCAAGPRAPVDHRQDPGQPAATTGRSR